MTKMTSAMTSPKPERKWKAIISSSADEGVRNRKDATEAKPIAAVPKQPSRAAVASMTSRVPVNSLRPILRKTASVATSTPP